MKPFFRRPTLLLALAAGLFIRLVFLPMPGTEDMRVFQTWGALALHEGVTQVYAYSNIEVLTKAAGLFKGVFIHYPAPLIQTDIGPVSSTPDYPPGSILLLKFSAASCKFLQGGKLRFSPLFNACMNLPPVLFSLAIAGILWTFLKQERIGRVTTAILSFWLNPALILTSPVLGYQEPVFAFFGILSLLLAYRRKYTLSVISIVLSCLIKPQGVFAVPILGMLALADGGWRLVWRCGTRFLLSFLVCLIPLLFAGRLLGMFRDILGGAMDPWLSSQQLNLWWVVGAGLHALNGGVVWDRTVPMVRITDFTSAVGFSPNLLALVVLVVFTAANIYFFFLQVRKGNRFSIFWASAIEVFGYTMLMTHVHENHLYAFFVYATPLLVLPVGVFRKLFWTLSSTYGLNLYLFDGFGQGYKGSLPWIRTLPGIDMTIVLALLNLVIFVLIVQSRHWLFDGTAPGIVKGGAGIRDVR
jgi:hypothetical protein